MSVAVALRGSTWTMTRAARSFWLWLGLAGGASLLGFAFVARTDPISDEFTSAALNIYSNVLAVIGTALGFLAAWRSHGRSRTAWCVLASAMFCWMVGDIVWMAYGLAGYEPPPYPGIPDIGYLAMPPLMVVGLVKLMIGETWQQRLRRALVPTAIALAVLSIAWHFVLLPQFHQSDSTLAAKLVSAAYPACDIAVMVLALWAAFDNRRGAARVPLALLGGGLALLAAGDVSYSLATLHDSFAQGHWIDYIWISSLIFLAGAGAAQWKLGADYATGEASNRTQRPWLMAAPMALVPLSLGFCTLIEMTGDLARDIPLLVMLMLLGVFSTIEPALALFENDRLNRRLNRSMEDLERASRAKSEFLSRMSHELRTPMNAVLGFGQLLEMDDLNEEQLENVGYIMSSGHHLLGLIDEVLDIARIEAGRMDVVTAPFDPAAIIGEVMDMTRPAAVSAGIELLTSPAHPSLRFSGDIQRTRQAVLNLVSNAIKYNRQQGSVAVSAVVAGSRGRIEVTDTGPGIPPEKLKRLFEPFDRLGAEYTAVPGTGLGLALSKALVEAMDGTLSVESIPGEGSTFTIELPLAEEAEQLPAAA